MAKGIRLLDKKAILFIQEKIIQVRAFESNFPLIRYLVVAIILYGYMPFLFYFISLGI